MDIVGKYASFPLALLAVLLMPALSWAETIEVGKKVIQGMAISVELEPPKMMQMMMGGMGGMGGMGRGMGGMGGMAEWKKFRPNPGELTHHLTVVLAHPESGEHIPAAKVTGVILNKKTGGKKEMELPAMFGKNLIYGTNVFLKPGKYSLVIKVGPPGLMRVEGAFDKWLKPTQAQFSFEVPG